MERRSLGKTGLEVSRLGVGLAEVGGLSLDEESTAGRVLNRALDSGINFLDTAACYGNSEELIGRTVSHRRNEYILATKAGHAVEDEETAWTRQTITRSIERSLRRLQTDHLDIVQLHSCGVDVLEKGDVIQALQAAKEAGKTRFIGYSGDNESAAWAVDSGLFDTLQTSYNLVDQKARLRLFDQASAQGMGIIVKRPIANAAWGAPKSPSSYADRYFERYQRMRQDGELPDAPEDRILLALGFTFAHPAVDTAIVGTSNPDHMQANIRMVGSQLPISRTVVEELQRRYEHYYGQKDVDWPQLG